MPHQVVYVRGELERAGEREGGREGGRKGGREGLWRGRGRECYLLFWFSDGEMSPSGDGHTAVTCIAATACDAQVIVITESTVDDII